MGCRSRDLVTGNVIGQVELYMFRVWADLNDHEPCEDGSVIGWDSRLWGVTSGKARQRDVSLLCGGEDIHTYIYTQPQILHGLQLL